MEDDSLGLLLQFKDAELEDRWRRYSNARFVDLDKLWTIGMFFISVKVYVSHWELVSLSAVVVHMGVAITLLTVLLLWLQSKHTDVYVKWRVPLVLGVRFSREFCTAFFLRTSANIISPVAVAGAATCLHLASPGKQQLVYILSRFVAYPAPFKLQLPSVLAAVWAVLSVLPQQCVADVASEAWIKRCSATWVSAFDRLLGRLWVFDVAAGPSLRPSVTPADACLLVKRALLVAIGALAPLLIYSSIEENWRLAWLSPDGNAPLRPSLLKRAIYDVALFLLGSAIIYQACLLLANAML